MAITDKQVMDNLRRMKDANKLSDPIIRDIADETLRLSVKEVPHDKGVLEDSGVSIPIGEAHYQVGYHKTYAARLHENPQYNFQKGRKGKYLEDPIKNNLGRFGRFYRDQMFKAIRARLR